ncbi:serine/arginine-rich SC35-like splicing factor SCL33 [Zea mays]|nr:serine/arginine-rich SC35-like splicing factor SCL33 [Zea mays]|eukprot:XP_020398908.1 serine/arginine-rich SC35-like splicing factor SCL33 [Zea mays]
MDGKMLLGRKIAVVFVEENRKKPSDMRAREKISGRGRSYDGRLRSRSPGLYDSPRVDHGPKAEATRQHFSESTIQGPRLLDLGRDLCRVPSCQQIKECKPHC